MELLRFACLVNDGFCGKVFGFEIGRIKYGSGNRIIERETIMFHVRLTSGLDLALSDVTVSLYIGDYDNFTFI